MKQFYVSQFRDTVSFVITLQLVCGSSFYCLSILQGQLPSILMKNAVHFEVMALSIVSLTGLPK